jgi:hypothetical protein
VEEVVLEQFGEDGVGRVAGLVEGIAAFTGGIG